VSDRVRSFRQQERPGELAPARYSCVSRSLASLDALSPSPARRKDSTAPQRERAVVPITGAGAGRTLGVGNSGVRDAQAGGGT
jgi:hypothetical protein